MKIETNLKEYKDERKSRLGFSGERKYNYVQANANGKGFWNERKEKLKQKFPVITDEDLCFYEGKEKEMMERLGYKLGITKTELVSIIVTL